MASIHHPTRNKSPNSRKNGTKRILMPPSMIATNLLHRHPPKHLQGCPTRLCQQKSDLGCRIVQLLEKDSEAFNWFRSFYKENGPLPKSIYHDGARWGAIGQKATICFGAYSVAIFMAVGSWAGVFPPYQATVIMVVSFVLEIVAKFGVKLSKTYMHNVLVDDVGTMPILAATVLMPGLHPKVRLLAVLPLFLTALLSLGQICKFHIRLPSFVRDFWSPLASAKARKQVMRARADVEVGLGIIMVVGALGMYCAPITVILFWNFMMMRYMMSSWTQDSFQRMDKLLSPVLLKVPGIKQGYQALKGWLYSYVDPESKSAGKLCTIL